MVLGQSVFAGQIRHEAFVDLEEGRTYFGTVDMSHFGVELASGDFNADGITDLVIGAPLTSYNDIRWSGAVIVYYGGTFKKTIIWGLNEDEQIGHSLAVGDLDHDGTDDLVIGSYRGGDERVGKVYIIGGKDFTSLQEVEVTVGQTIDGIEKNEAFGLELAIEDLDNNGYEDLLVGAPWASFDGLYQVGAVYGFLNFEGKLALNTPRTFYGSEKGERFGSKIVTGQLDNDDYPEVIIGAYKSDSKVASQGGAVYLYEGRKNYDLEILKADKFWKGNLDGQWFGFDIEVNEGKLFITSFPYWRAGIGGAVFVVDPEKSYSLESVYSLDDGGDRVLGASLEFGDMNGDGEEELMVGALPINPNGYSDYSGAVFGLEKDNFNLVQTVYGLEAEDWFGADIAAYDEDGDGLVELFFAAPYANEQKGRVVKLNGRAGYLGEEVEIVNSADEVSRGELISMIVEDFNLKESRAEEYEKCLDYKEFCLFNFMAASNFEGMELEDGLMLYPDVAVGSEFYDDINFATVLGIINGYMNDHQSPFRPERPITRIQALKVVLGALDVVDFKYRFEIEDIEGQRSLFNDVDPRIAHMWWYPRYSNYAKEMGLVDDESNFRPDDFITREEALDLITRGVQFINASNEEVNPRGSTDEEAVTGRGDEEGT